MNRLSSVAAGLLGAGLLALAGPASAAVMTISYTGTFSGDDFAGVIGFAGVHFDDTAFTASFTYDTAKGSLSDFAGTAQYLQGGSAIGAEPAVTSALLTVGGQTTDLTQAFNGSAETYGPAYSQPFSSRVAGQFEEDSTTSFSTGDTFGYLNFYLGGYGAAPARLDQAWEGAVDGYGNLSAGLYDANGDGGPTISLNFTPTYVQVRSVDVGAAVPEPASWAMMLTGFFGLGAAVRFRRRRTPASAGASRMNRRSMGVANRLAGVVAVCGLLAAAPASAAVMVATYVGTVSGGIDYGNVFGQGAGASLAGQAFTETFTYDTQLGIDDGEPGFYQEQDGGTAWGAPSPMLGAALIIAGRTYDVAGELSSEVVSATGVESLHRAEGATGSLFLYLNHNSPGDLAAPVATTGGTLGGGTFRLYEAGGGLLASGTLHPVTLTIAAAAPAGGAVPEPQTWALMVTGLGLAGWALRRQGASGRRISART
jgi:hypothetical protein